ncbi:hypothetical protein PtrSN002B_008027 [Pyrenophora tritici-repentis]|nr:hypothetical protein TUN199_08298 [Pyrenophora tritici-repentis]KAI1531023.1 hypothetical protein PtrSN001A_007900 [Pyrenophora tritici-repentis]KAI1542861.1 hypothetical protein PtrSN002B_008027 [Pyrenophora tritici-repentis]KAI1571547.1 hypothetical protein PtrEW7m1_007843 [Pyrenophora tritici-repentis]KAI1585943.1 hypothetical protein PtrEW13061_007798 [Pyrenophora tritici-repentis]
MSPIRAFATRRAPFVFVQRAAFSQSIARPVGKESALHHEGRAEEVKADRSETGKDIKEQIKKLQEEAKKV